MKNKESNKSYIYIYNIVNAYYTKFLRFGRVNYRKITDLAQQVN